MNIGLFTSVYFNNIGNGFLDLATEYEINSAKSENDCLVKLSQCANFAASMGRLFAIKENVVVKWAWNALMDNKHAKKLHNKTYNIVKMQDVLSPASMFDVDFLVIPGCVLTIHFLKIYYDFLKNKTQKGCKIIFIGASGNYYTNDEISYVKKCLSELKPYAIMTRDSVAYELYSEYTDNPYNGIDNAFFVNCLEIPSLKSSSSPYSVVNLELDNNKGIKKKLELELLNNGYNVIYSDHCPYPYTKVSKMVKQNNTVISDYPLDYLTLYRNAEAVYTDRVHACITSLSFGTPVTLFSSSPRKALFENVGITPVSCEVLSITGLEKKQRAQVEFLKSIIK